MAKPMQTATTPTTGFVCLFESPIFPIDREPLADPLAEPWEAAAEAAAEAEPAEAAAREKDMTLSSLTKVSCFVSLA
eukprot:CAMPEP_0114561128 /NCGR_PEP_ID=MMETSP0114-20121206/11837_1 /TAXON_ID=31324 /ORGANISM="Goniomonas sp, Strain m" /LENGTH=76 /DNA_ID=CAMNT_0001746739 /DNA_START=80 /DNA_END=310 /DNA_ORIENTATION=-